jgi:hypothetical protein
MGHCHWHLYHLEPISEPSKTRIGPEKRTYRDLALGQEGKNSEPLRAGELRLGLCGFRARLKALGVVYVHRNEE